jgi:DNA-binding IclR family transcriptional regulator
MAERESTNSLERALHLLQYVGQRPGGLTNAELSRELAIPKSTCSYILTRLQREGYVSRDDENGRYTIGLGTLALAHGALREVGFRTRAEPTLYKLSAETGLRSNIGILERNRVLMIDHVESPDFVEDPTDTSKHPTWIYYPVKAERDIGSELPVHATSVGRVLLAFLPFEQQVEFFRKNELAKLTPQTVVSAEELLQELEQVRRQGYGWVDQQYHLTARGLAAPIYDSNGIVRAALGVVGNRDLPIWKDEQKLIELVTEAGKHLSARLP